MTRVSLLSPYDPLRPEVLVPFAELVRRSSLDAFWQGNSVAGDSALNFSYLAGRGYHLPYGIGVRVTGFLHPTAAAGQAAVIARMTGKRVVAGIGPGGRTAQTGLYGAPLPSVLDHMRSYSSAMREALAAHQATDVELGMGVLRPRMAHLCGEVADSAVTWLAPPSFIRDVIVPQVRDGARSAGRAAARIVAVVPFGFEVGDRALEFARHTVGTHLSLPHYRDALRSAGVTPPGPDGIGTAEFDRLVEAGVVFPDGAAGFERALEAYSDAGVDELVINVSGSARMTGPRATLDGLIDFVDALDRRTSRSEVPAEPVPV